MTDIETKLIAIGIYFGFLIATVLPASVAPFVMLAIAVWANRKDLMRAVRQWWR